VRKRESANDEMKKEEDKGIEKMENSYTASRIRQG